VNKLILIFSILLLSALAQSADAQTSVENNSLHDFTSDGCSMAPDGAVATVDTEFVPCCVQHDIAYWAGGTAEEKLTADNNLRICIKEKSNAFVAAIYYRSVRLAGGPYLPTAFHWGYGWEKRRGYAPLSEEQTQMAQEKISHTDWVQIYTSLDIELVFK
jgi:hypothetical protein